MLGRSWLLILGIFFALGLSWGIHTTTPPVQAAPNEGVLCAECPNRIDVIVFFKVNGDCSSPVSQGLGDIPLEGKEVHIHGFGDSRGKAFTNHLGVASFVNRRPGKPGHFIDVRVDGLCEILTRRVRVECGQRLEVLIPICL